ncbi:MAG: tetratricopeptide repeat protein [Methylococcales bacterium]|nr:tetratricopeptide repeat protein [Methylococcales bacterium]
MKQLTDNPDVLDTEIQQISLKTALQLAIRLHQANQYEYAEDIYRQLLELEPENPNILHYFGLLRHQRGYATEGVEWIKKALLLAPDYVDAENNLGNIYLQTGQAELAEPHFRRVIDINPNFATVYGNLGIALRELGQHEEAAASLWKAIELQPNDAHLYQNLGNIYRHSKNYHEAVGMYRKSLELKPFDVEAYRKLSRTFYLMGEIEQCIGILTQWLDYDPENPTALHLIAAYTRTNAPPRASDAYVRETFDGFAMSFDGVLKRLDYQAPFLVQHALQQINPDANNWTVLDAGCGTGLCGALVKPLVKRLDGVDLSPKMLEHAHARDVYDALFEAELTEFFLQADAIYNAITCADTFCYFGELTDVMHAAGSALMPEGWFIFTLEKIEETEANEGFRLNLHGRYSHTEAYISNTLINAGFRIHCIETAALRKEGYDNVAGLVVTAQLL